MSIQNNFPAVKPTMLLDFASVKALDPRVTFTRASTGTFYGTQTAKAEENLLLQSQTFETTWLTINSTVTANTEVAPDGTTTAETITDNATSGNHVITQTPTCTAGIPYTFSAFLKEGTNQYGVVFIFSSAANENYVTAVVDLDAGTISKSQNGTSTTSASTSIVSVGNGWYRVSVTGTAASAFSRARIGLTDSGTPTIGINGLPADYVGTGTTIYAWGAQLEQRSAVTAYTATTTQPITNYIPVLETAASGVARFDHNPITDESLGLLIEGQRTNLLLRSEEFDNAYWSKTASSITANTVVAPDGALTGDALIENTENTQHFLSRGETVADNTVVTLSVFLKAAGRSWSRVSIGTKAGTFPGAFFNLSAGTVGTIVGTPTATSITPVGNGWFRCSVSVDVLTGGSTPSGIVYMASADGTITYTGDGYSGIYIWGAQLEAGAFPTSYIPTVASQVTRSADAASMTGTNFSSWYNQAEGTLYAEATSGNSTNDSGRIASINDNTSNNRVEVLYSSATQAQAILSSNNVTQASLTETVTKTNSNKTAFAYKVNDTNASFNSSVETTDTSCDVPVVFQINIGARSGNSNPINGTIRKLSYYPKRLANAELQALTQN